MAIKTILMALMTLIVQPGLASEGSSQGCSVIGVSNYLALYTRFDWQHGYSVRAQECLAERICSVGINAEMLNREFQTRWNQAYTTEGNFKGYGHTALVSLMPSYDVLDSAASECAEKTRRFER